MSALANIMKERRGELGWPQSRLADEIEINVRQVARYESGEQQPALPVAARLVDALGVSLAELAGQISYRLELGGDWWAGWQTSKDGIERVDVHAMQIVQRENSLSIHGDRVGSIEDGGYAWDGEAKLWDNESILGWYRASDGAVRSKGTMYFALHPQGQSAQGRWVGQSYDGNLISGWSAMARTEEEVQKIMEDLLGTEPLK